MKNESYDLATQTGSIALKVDMSQTTYSFSYKDSHMSDPTFVTLKTLPTSAVLRDREGDSCFTGTMLGLFAQGMDGEACHSPAYFHSTSFISIQV